MEEYYTIHTPDYYNNIFIELHNLQKQGILCDVTLIAEDGEVMAHKVVLMAVSKYFRDKLSPVIGSNPTKICLKGISVCELANLIQYIYTGKLVVSKENMDVILEISEILGLTGVVDGYKDIIMYEEVKRQKGRCIPCKTFTCHSALNVEPATSSHGAGDVTQGGKSTAVASSKVKSSTADLHQVAVTQSSVDKNTRLVQTDITSTTGEVTKSAGQFTVTRDNATTMVTTNNTVTTGNTATVVTTDNTVTTGNTATLVTPDNIVTTATVVTTDNTVTTGNTATLVTIDNTITTGNTATLVTTDNTANTIETTESISKSTCNIASTVTTGKDEITESTNQSTGNTDRVTESPSQSTDTTSEVKESTSQPSTTADYNFSSLYDQQYMDVTVGSNSPLKNSPACGSQSKRPVTSAVSDACRNIAEEEAQHQDLLTVAIETLSDAPYLKHQNQPELDKAVMSISNRGKADMVVPLDEPMEENTVEPFVNGKTNTKTFTMSAGTVNNELGGKTDVYTVSLDPLSVKTPLVMPRPKRSKTQKEKDAEEKARMYRQKKAQILQSDLKAIIAGKAAVDGNESKQRRTRSTAQNQDFQYESLSKAKKKVFVPRVVYSHEKLSESGAVIDEHVKEVVINTETQGNKELADDCVQVDLDSDEDEDVDVEGMIANDIVGVMTNSLDCESNAQTKSVAVITGENSSHSESRVDAEKQTMTNNKGNSQTDNAADLVEATESVVMKVAECFPDNSDVAMSPASHSDDETSEKLRSSSQKRKTRTPKKILCTDSENSDCGKDRQENIPVVRLRKRSYCLGEVNDITKTKIPKSENVLNSDDVDSDSGAATSVQFRVSKSLMPEVRLKKHSAEEILQITKEVKDKKLFSDSCSETEQADEKPQWGLQTGPSLTTKTTNSNVLKRKVCDDSLTSSPSIAKYTPKNNSRYLILDKDDLLKKVNNPNVRNEPKAKLLNKASNNEVIIQVDELTQPTYGDGTYVCPDKSCLFSTMNLPSLMQHRNEYHSITTQVEEEVETTDREEEVTSDTVNVDNVDTDDDGHVPWQAVQVDVTTDEIRCPKCPKTFKTPGLMKKHYFASHSDNQFKCASCDYVARVKSNLNTHMKLKHSLPQNGVNKCQFCSYATVVLGNLKNHMLHAHGLIMITSHVKHSNEKFYDCSEGDIATIDGKQFDPKTMSLPKNRPRISGRRTVDKKTNTPENRISLFKLPVNEFVQEVMKRHEEFLKQPQKDYSYMCNSIAKATEQPSFPQASPQIRNNHANKLYNMQKMKLPVITDEHNGYVAGQSGIPGVDNEVEVTQHEYPEVVMENVESGESNGVLTITEQTNGTKGEDMIVINQSGKQTVVRSQDFYDTLSASGHDSNQTLEVIAALLQAGEQIEIREQCEQEDYVEIQNV